MRTILFYLIAGLLAGFEICPVAVKAGDWRYGLCINFGIQTFAKPGEQGELPARRFAPASVNVQSWAHAAKEAGSTFALLTVKTANGFCLWQTADYDYDLVHSPFKGDIIGDFVAACDAEGILPGAFYSIPDAHNEGVAHATGPVPNLYFNFIKRQITELHTKYPGLRVQIFGASEWLSSEQWTDLIQALHSVNPQCMIVDAKHGGVMNVESGTVLKSWRWQPDAALVSAAEIFRLYQHAQAANKSFVLTVGADPAGKIPENQLLELSKLKELIANPPAPQTSAPAEKSNAAERLKELDSLYQQGLINKEDYEQKKEEVLDSL